MVKGGALDLMLDRLVARRDSFAVFVQGNAFGYQRNTLEKSGAGWKYSEDTQIGPIVQQHTEVSFGADLAMGVVKQTGKSQGKDTKIDVSYAGGRAKGSATTPQADGSLKTVQVDAEVPAGAVDDNVLSALLPAFKWAAGAKFTVPVFQSGKGALTPVTLTVSGEEIADVPAGKIAAWKVELTGLDGSVTFWIEKAAPNRLVKIGIVGAPIEIRLVK